MSSSPRVEIECDDASALFARLVSETRALELVRTWGEVTGQRELLDVTSVGKAADVVGPDRFRRFVQQVSGGLWRALEVAPETVSDEEKRSFRALEPPEDECLLLQFPDFAEDPLLRVRVQCEGANEGEWLEDYDSPVVECHGTQWLAEVVRNDGYLGSPRQSKLQVRGLTSLADVLDGNDNVVFWYQYRFKRVHHFSVPAGSDLGALLLSDPRTSPSAITLKSNFFGAETQLLVGLFVDGGLLPIGDILGPWTETDDFGPCNWGWSQPNQPPQSHNFVDDEKWFWS
jgi:hypothetical protein